MARKTTHKPRSRVKHARTAGGKKATPEVLAQATADSQEGYRERTEVGHRAAGRTPPSERGAPRSSGATRKIDEAIRDFPVTEDEKLLQPGTNLDSMDFTRSDPWRVMRIMGEVIEGFATLAHVRRGV